MTRLNTGLHNLLAARYRRLFEAGEKTLQGETRRFLEWLFDEPPIRPITIELLHRDRADALRFIDHQCELFVRLGTLAHDLLAIHPHPVGKDGFVCDNPSCQQHLRQLDELLRSPRTMDGDWLAGSSTAMDATPISQAIEHLRRIDQQHTRLEDAHTDHSEHEAFRVALIDIWLRHRVGFQHRVERLRTSAGLSIRELIRWAGLGEAGGSDAHMSVTHAWRHLRQLHLELQSIIASTQELDCLITRFKHRSESADAARLLQLATGQRGHEDEDASLTRELARYLQHHGIQAWSSHRASEEVAWPLHGGYGPVRPIVVDSVAYAGRASEEHIRRALRRLHAAMLVIPIHASISQSVLVLFRLGGPVYSVPSHLEFERFSIGMVHIDLARGSVSSNPAYQVVPLGREELLSAVASTPRAGPRAGAPYWPGGCLLWRLECDPIARGHPLRSGCPVFGQGRFTRPDDSVFAHT